MMTGLVPGIAHRFQFCQDFDFLQEARVISTDRIQAVDCLTKRFLVSSRMFLASSRMFSVSPRMFLVSSWISLVRSYAPCCTGILLGVQ